MNTSPLLPGSVTIRFAAHLLRTLRVIRRIFARVGISIPLLVWCSCASALNPQQAIDHLYHSSWTAKQGITGNVTALAQTTDGYLWVGTSDRLLRFNGISFESYRPEVGSLGAASVSALMATPDGGLWIGYARGGASFLRNGQITNYSDSDGFPVSKVRCFAQDRAGTIWVAAVGGLARLEGSRWRLLNPDENNPYGTARSVLVDHGGTLWVSSGNEIFFLPPREERFVRTGLPCGAGCVLLQGLDGAIIFYDSVAKGLRAIRPSDGGSTEVFPGINVSARSAIFDRDGGLWVGGDGLSRLSFPYVSTRGTFRRAAQTFRSSDGLSNDAVESIIEDREGNIWVGTDGGLDRFRNRNVTWFPLKGGPFSLVAGSDGRVWAGSRGSSLVRADDGQHVVQGAAEVYNAYHDPGGSIWLSADRTLLHWQKGKLTQVPLPDQVKKLSLISSPPDPVIASAITKDHSNDLWVAFGGSGEFRLHNDMWTYIPILADHPDWSAGYAFTDSSDCIWLFWGDRIAKYDHGKVGVFDATDGLAIGPPEAMAERNHILWVGGESGLAFLREGHFYPIQSTENAGFTSVTGIVVTENGDVWLSTGPGIIHIPNNEIESVIEHPEHRVQFELFDLTSDLPDAIQRTGEVYSPGAVEAGDGSLWFATQRGAVRIDPSHISRNSVPPPVSISAMVADNRSYSVHPTVSLPALTQNVVIHYDALSLAVPERVRFRYKLDGWDKEWHEAGGRREAYFTHLAPAKYTLHVFRLRCETILLRHSSVPAKSGYMKVSSFGMMTAIAHGVITSCH
jgi:ligand-binding sensor domain-containing protein